MGKEKKYLFVIGTRPEAIKMAPLIHEFKNKGLNISICLTGQHKEMLDQVMLFFDIHPDFNLDIMKPGQDLFTITADVITGLKIVFEKINPDFVFVHGDTTTCLSTSLAAFYFGIKICHIEAGLRTYNKMSPYPEEMNRVITSRLADFHFAPTETAKRNLILEQIDATKIVVTGNTVIDALLLSLNKLKNSNTVDLSYINSIIDNSRKIILVTGHRRENFGEGFLNICTAIKEISLQNENVQIIYPVHLNPNVQKPVLELLQSIPNILLIKPLSYAEFIWLMNCSYLILTDSGGVQEEAPSLGKPVLVMRNTTERPEAVEAGTVKLVGTDVNKIIQEVNLLLKSEEAYLKMQNQTNPYGDGKASKKILNFIVNA